MNVFGKIFLVCLSLALGACGYVDLTAKTDKGCTFATGTEVLNVFQDRTTRFRFSYSGEPCPVVKEKGEES